MISKIDVIKYSYLLNGKYNFSVALGFQNAVSANSVSLDCTIIITLLLILVPHTTGQDWLEL